MKRVRIGCAEVTDWHALVEAAGRAARSKRGRRPVRAFFADFERSLGSVRDALERARMPAGTWRPFRIRDPKSRLIHAAPFADRVAHHALMRPVEAPLDRWQPPTSHACRRGMGTHTAVAQARRRCARYPWYAKMDVSGYFEHIDHEVLLGLLHRRLAGRWLFATIEAVLGSYKSAPGKGLPIGALTSQHFANAYLVPADRWLIDHPLCRGHCRYMDDTVVWAESREAANALARGYREVLGDTLRLKIKPFALQRSRRGLAFCGSRIDPSGVRPGRRRQRRFKERLRAWEAAWTEGLIDTPTLQRNVDALVAMLGPGRSTAWRRDWLRHRKPPASDGGEELLS